MRHIKKSNIEFNGIKNGEAFSVLVGRHQKHGGAKHHTIAISQIESGAASDLHYHKEVEESYYIISGRGYAIINSKRFDFESGDLLTADPNEYHQFFNTGNTVLEYLVITAPLWTPQDSYK